QRGDDDVAAGLELPIALHDDAVAQAVLDECLLRLGYAELPRRTGVLDRRERRRTGSAVVAGNQDDITAGFRNSGGDRTDAHLRNQLDVHARTWVGVLQVVDELLDVFDRINVVVGRRADQANARCGVPRFRDPRIDLVAGQLAALAGLGALGHLDLEVV